MNDPKREEEPGRSGSGVERGVGRPVSERVNDDARDFDDGQDDAHCWECGLLHDECECHVGEECGRWRNGRLDKHCTKAGSEECDFECPYNR